jgi:acyl transferase domain-containing protein/enoyl-CoA hydratase/carnithine racemase/acyl carrier protein/SAM-dependent methyltransferase/NADP-dependent 3-hydroxy acid dehydrogenase YdfG
MLEILNRYSHGLASIPILVALRDRGCLARIAQAGSVSAEELAREFSANPAYLEVALRMLVGLDWIRPAADRRYEARPGLANSNVIPDRIMDLYRFPFDVYVQGGGECLEPWLERSEQRWYSEHPYLPDYLDGLLIVPLVLLLCARGQLVIAEETDEGSAAMTLSLNVHPAIHREVERLFLAKKWAVRSVNVLHLNRTGRFVIERIPVTAVLASYRPLLGGAQELLFGDAARVFARDPGGVETHVDRVVNVIGSGFQHEKYFAALSDMVVRHFDNESFASQPKYIADMGSGNGELLRRLYETVRERTRRGRVLERYPLTLIAVDYNDVALAVASRTLEGLNHICLKGDIGDPLSLQQSLGEHGVDDLDRVLHVRSFLDHDRPYRQPEDRKGAARRSRFGGRGIYIDAEGHAILPGDMIQSTVEHFQRWSTLVNQHGLIVLEAHCLAADVTARYLDETESFHFDASQSLSRQYLLEAETFVACAAEAGLFCPKGYWQRFPKTMPFTRISLNCFEKRPYSVRHAWDDDLPALLALRESWSASEARDRDAEMSIEARLDDFPEGQFILQRNGQILALVCCDREGDDSIQLVSTHLLPGQPTSHVQDLLGFVEQYWILKGDIRRVLGIEKSRSAMEASASGKSLALAIAGDVAANVAHYPFKAADDPRRGERELGDFSFRWVLAHFRRMGAMREPGETYERDQLKRILGVARKYDRYFEALIRRLEAEGVVILDGSLVETTRLITGYALTAIEEEVAEFRESFRERYPACTSLLNLTAACLSRYEEIITGQFDAADVVFADGGMDLFAELFRGDPVSDYFNRIVAEAVLCATRRVGERRADPRRRDQSSKVRILEIGAGTGGASGAILDAVGTCSGSVEFCITDLSPSLLRYTQRRFARKYPWVDYRILDIEDELSRQGFTNNEYDVIVAANVLHDTRSVEFALQQVRKLLNPGGLLILNEYTSVKDCLLFSGALLHGYWLFQDPEKRLRDTCLLGVSQWITVLEHTGFAAIGAHALPTQNLGLGCSQSVMLCEAVETTNVENPPSRDQDVRQNDQNTGFWPPEAIMALIKRQALALLGEARASAYSPQRPVMDMGLDSIELVELKSLISEQLAVRLSPTFFFEHETPEKIMVALSEMLSNQQPTELLPPRSGGAGSHRSAADEIMEVMPSAGAEGDAIAIVGVACRFPGGAVSAESFWKLLESGKHGIGSVPAGRWRWPSFIDVCGEHKGIDKAGFLDHIDEFDPLFFRISPREAELMDPQQRLLLELSWEAMEDGGHRPSELSGRKIGVFIGVCHGDYREVLTTASDSPEPHMDTGSAYSLLANRLSYFYDFKGPSLTVDTACSSSLFALHNAVTAMRRGDCEQALVGAANLLCTPTHTISYYRAGMLSVTGRCRTFDEAADGYVRGEGGAMLLLKPLTLAVAEGDSIYGLVKGTALNHGGQAASLTAPKPEAQAAVIEAAWRMADVALESVGYIETHGTGTKLGDPVEIAGLTEAFRRLYRARGEAKPATPHCGLGSVKTNIGHLEGAAGLAGLIKVLMAIRHRSIPATLNFERLNPDIDFTDNPFYIVGRRQPWLPYRDRRGQELPRRAGVSSFGFGGANAHVVLEEYVPGATSRRGAPARSAVVVLSAPSSERLRKQAEQLLFALRERRYAEIDLVDIAYTLQVGREPMAERLGLLVSSLGELEMKLQAFLDGNECLGLCRGQARPSERILTILAADRDFHSLVERWIAQGRLENLLELWAKGLEVDWNKLYDDVKPQRISLPTYPFARERYWVSAESRPNRTCLHPLLHQNTSVLGEQRFSSRFTGEEFFLAGHQIGGRRLLPAVAYVEMAQEAIARATGAAGDCARPDTYTTEMRNLVWLQPLVLGQKSVEVHIRLFPEDDNEVGFEVHSGLSRSPASHGIDSTSYGRDIEEDIVHCQGRTVRGPQPASAKLDIEELKQQMKQGQVLQDTVYATCGRMGLVYGPEFQAITAIHRGSGQLLAQLRLPREVESTYADYVLHPSLMDGALQAAIGFIDDAAEFSKEPLLPFALDSLRIVSRCTPAMYVWVRHAPGRQTTDKVLKQDIDLCDEHGNVCVEMRGFSTRALRQEIEQDRTTGRLLAVPVWQVSGVEAPAKANKVGYAEHHVIVCEMPEARVDNLQSLFPQTLCLSLWAEESKTIAQRYSDYAVACFERIKAIFLSKPQGKVLVQIVIASDQEQALFAGLSGLLKTATLENPQLIGQLILVPANIMREELAKLLQEEKTGSGLDTTVLYEGGVRRVLRWEELAADLCTPPLRFKDHGVYLITGGLGSLGMLFAREILDQTRWGRVVLTGRSDLITEKRARLEGLSAESGRVSYRQVDLSDLDQVKQLVATIQEDYGRLNGILHSAGMIADNFILKKASKEFREVLVPKVTGTYHLDQASQDVELDFFVLFSSIAGAMGNVGQADYACANGFMDQFAAYRNRQVAAKQRHGRTRSINWPWWRAGGMSLDATSQDLLTQTIGIQALQTPTGLQAFHHSLALPHDQTLVAEGSLPRMRSSLLSGAAVSFQPEEKQSMALAEIDSQRLVEETQEYLRKQFSGLLKLPSSQIDPHAGLEKYGIDSILAMRLTNQLEKTFGSLSKTLFFEYQTIRGLADYFLSHHSKKLTALLAAASNGHNKSMQPVQVASSSHSQPMSSRRFSRVRRTAPISAGEYEPIAVIGLSGRYPEAMNLDAYWQNLREGKDCIVEVPQERWDWREYFSEDRTATGHHFSKWGGFIAGVDEFDPLFFNISPKEAKYIDPQERLFLQHVWMAVEDAGYTRASLQIPSEQDLPGQVGVYVGVMYSEYQLFGAESKVQDLRMGFAGNLASIANRVSYTLNLHGPSMTLDTMCSSSLTAIHLACQDLMQGRTTLGIAGGVNVSIHPNKYLLLSAGQFISSGGHCQSFGEGGDGYIPGEGVGVVVLKRFSEAQRDGDHIYGIIRGSALNHGGKTNGYTVPNPQAQASVISRALAEAKTDARHISYVEAHGTGTKLGDPIEIAALSKAFEQYTQEKEFCPIGSAKSNIGHCEAAAGIAGLTKVLLQMQHKQIVPSLHSAQLNPHIDFFKSPFVVNQTLRAWEPPVVAGKKLQRIAGISSFGAGGSNAHLIVEEYQAVLVQPPEAFAPVAVLLSARTAEQLRQKARELLDVVRGGQNEIDLVSMAYTLQVGREGMEERLGMEVSSVEQLVAKLQAYVEGELDTEDVYQGQVKRNQEALALFSSDADLRQTVDKWVVDRKLSKLLELWAKGLEIDWGKLYGEVKPRRMSLPTYPFAKERYWIDVTVKGDAEKYAAASGVLPAVLHPLLHRNTSDLKQQSYSVTLSGEEFFLKEHHVEGERIVPAAVYLEMARAAIENATHPSPETQLELRDLVWEQPIVFRENKITKRQISIALMPNQHNNDQVDYEIYSEEAEGDILHSQGSAILSCQGIPDKLDLEQIKARTRQGSRELLVQLRQPKVVEATSADYVLHPSLVGDAFESALRWIAGSCEGSLLRAWPHALESLRIVSTCSAKMMVWVRYSAGSHAGDKKIRLDIELCDEGGNVCAQIRGMSWLWASRYSVEQGIAQAESAASSPTNKEIATTSAVRKEIAFAPWTRQETDFRRYERAIPSSVERHKKPSGIALAAPTEFFAVLQGSTRRTRIALASTALVTSKVPVGPRVRLFDCGHGIYSLQISASGSHINDGISDWLQALEKVKEEESVRVLMVSGLEGLQGREDHNEAIEQKLYRAMLWFPCPTIAVLERGASGTGFLLAALCDLMVLNEDAVYGYTDAQSRLYPTPAVANLFSERFGNAQAQDLLYVRPMATGRQLRERGWTCRIVPEARVEADAEQLASTLATKSQTALRLLKQHLTCHLGDIVNSWVDVENVAPGVDTPSDKTAEMVMSASEHIQLDASVENVLVIKLRGLEGKELESELRDIFAKAHQSGNCKAMVLASEGNEFLAGLAQTSDEFVQELRRLILESKIPVVAALAGDAKGKAWLLSQLCDGCVYNAMGTYSTRNLGHSPVTARVAAAGFAHRLGASVSKEILLSGAGYVGADLQRRVGTLLVAEQGQVLSRAMELAASWTRLPRITWAAYKQHCAQRFDEMIRSLSPEAKEPWGEQPGTEQPMGSTGITLRSKVVTATAYPDGIVVVKMEDREAKNMFSHELIDGVREAFAYIEDTTAYKVVILTGYDSFFASGGTKESLLAIQARKARFTDFNVFQVAAECNLPVIAAMQGHGIGAGWCLGMLADVVLLSAESRYVSPYMNYGFTPGAGATYILPEALGQDLARESLLSGRPYTGRELRTRGVRLQVLSRGDVEEAAMQLARQIAQQPRADLVRLKQQWRAGLLEHLEEVYPRELAMHEKTFVGQEDTLALIQKNFYPEVEALWSNPQSKRAASAPQVEPEKLMSQQVEVVSAVSDSDALPAVRATLKALLANELQMRESEIQDQAQFVDLGLDSISGVTWIRKINEKYQTAIEATKVYSYPTLSQLSRYVKEEAEKQGTLPEQRAAAGADAVGAGASIKDASLSSPHRGTVAGRKGGFVQSRQRAGRFRRGGSRLPGSAIAVIGMGGQFPQAKNLEQYWHNIAQGKNCIVQVPAERWDRKAYYQPGEAVPSKTNSQWVGALEEYDRFDPLFFNISPTEAESMDPQQRLFLQVCWHGIEDAGYDARLLSGSKCGVFVGCTSGEYQQQSRPRRLSAQGFTGNAPSILAARIAYFLNLQGPCLALDTACSSSLVAIALACDSLQCRSSDLALAGGVYVMGGPEMHIMMAQAGMLSPGGRCFTFDQRADGLVPGEGVGVVVLKRLAEAERDKDLIYGVIEGWGVNQDGKSNGITAPNPEAQTRLEQEVYEKYGIDPEEIQLIEAHGTGTKLGDPIEMEGLKQAFKKYTQKQEYCALGSVKSNIGHCLTAAGVAGFIKVMLALQHQQLPPTINFERLNEHIELKGSPFYVNQRLQEWKQPGGGRRRAAISSFGFSGTNAHVVVGEYQGVENQREVRRGGKEEGKVIIIPLSARTQEQLEQKVRELMEFVRGREREREVEAIGYTLQVGREGMEERLGLLVGSVEELEKKLEAYLAGQAGMDQVYRGQAKPNQEVLKLLGSKGELGQMLVKWMAEKKLGQMLELWVKGWEVDWSKLYGEEKPRRVRLPLYPFAKERYWIEAHREEWDEAGGVLHPLLQRNSSDLNEQRYSSTFTGEEFFLRDHQVCLEGGRVEKVLPAAAYLEMVRAAVAQALPVQPRASLLELHNTVWAKPFVVPERKEVSIALFAKDDEQIDYEIYSIEEKKKVVHCQGQAIFTRHSAPAKLNISQLKEQMEHSRLKASDIYEMFTKMGLHYGPAHQGIATLYKGKRELLAHLHVPEFLETSHDQYVLHPSLIDSALQTSIGLIADSDHIPFKPRLPFVLESLRIISACPKKMVAWVRDSEGSTPTNNQAFKLNIDLCDLQGNVCLEMRGFALRTLQGEMKSLGQRQINGLVQEKSNCMKGYQTFNSNFYEKLIAEVASREVSVTEAVELE